jgi:hypothetical protein
LIDDLFTMPDNYLNYTFEIMLALVKFGGFNRHDYMMMSVRERNKHYETIVKMNSKKDNE